MPPLRIGADPLAPFLALVPASTRAQQDHSQHGGAMTVPDRNAQAFPKARMHRDMAVPLTGKPIGT